MVAEYESPFKEPPVHCNQPDYAVNYPYIHSSRDNCPVHDTEAHRNRPVHDVSIAWMDWARHREDYANGDDSAKERMLNFVTSDNPPDAVVKKQRERIDAFMVGVALAIILLACLAVFL